LEEQKVVSRSNVEAEYRIMTHTDSLDQCLCIVVISVLSTLPIILYCMKGPSILRLTIIFSQMLGPTKKVVPFQFTPSKQLADLLTKAVSLQVFSNYVTGWAY